MNSTDVEYIVVHCAYTTQKMDIGAKDIDRWHRDQGWLMIGYHGVIRRDGTFEAGRPLTKVGAHVRGINSKSVGICLAGGMADDKKSSEFNFTDAQMKTLRAKLEEWHKLFPKAEIRGHYEFDKKKTCPTFDPALWFKTGEIKHTY